MSNTNTGGPAFPAHGRWGRDGQLTEALQHNGMALRDYFAAKAMQGILAGTLTPEGIWSQTEVAETAYNVADAMLEARNT